MPEGPELHIAGQFVNQLAKCYKFSGKVVKSEVSLKNPSVDWDVPQYSIRAESRGKEVKLWLQECIDSDIKNKAMKQISILFRFGMSGSFKVSPIDDLPKHAHLRFFTKPNKVGETVQVLSFVDYRRFGRWEIDGDWGTERGPCPITDYENFRKNVVENLEDTAFCNKPICEVLLNQKYFNGIGNYLRAEILYRSNIAPFEEAKTALLPWKDALVRPIKAEGSAAKICDPIYLCHTLSCEVLTLGGGYNVENGLKEMSSFHDWLQCYQNPNMTNLTDRHKRTIWFYGEPGPLVPKNTKSRKPTPSKRSSGSETKSTKEELEELEDLKAKVPKFDMDEVKKLSHNIAMQQQMGEGPDAFNKKIKKSAKPRKMNTKNTKDDVKKEPVADPPIRLHNYPTRSSQRLAKEQK